MTPGRLMALLATLGYPSSPRSIVLGAGAAGWNATGVASEVPLVNVTCPGGLMGANGQICVTSMWTFNFPLTAGTKTLRVRHGGTTIAQQAGFTNNASQATYQTWIRNDNDPKKQKYVGGGFIGVGIGGTSQIAAATIDTTVDQVIQLSGQVGTISDTCRLESYLIELFPAA